MYIALFDINLSNIIAKKSTYREENLKAIISLIVILFSSLSYADCFDKAGNYYYIDPDYLRAIAYQESKFDKRAINKNDNNSIDYGIMQINSSTLKNLQKEYPQLNEDILLENACLNIFVGALVLKRNFDKLGRNWLAVGAYNAGTRNRENTIQNRYKYANLIKQHYDNIKKGNIIPPKIR